MPDDTSAPVSAEGLRERIAETLWKLFSLSDNPAPWSTVRSHPDYRHDLEKFLYRADAVLAALAGVPGDLPARMAAAIGEALNQWARPDAEETRGVRRWDFLAAAALSVRWEHAIALEAENERLRAVLASLDCEHGDGPECPHEAEVERLRAELAEASDEKLAAIKRISQLHAVTEGQLDLMTQMRDSEKARADGLAVERDALRELRQVTSDDTSAPVSAEGLRERIAETLLDPLKCCVVTPFPLTPIHGTCKDCWAKALAAADDVLAALAGVPGDLPARMAAAMRAHGLLTGGALPEGHGTCTCGHWTGTDWITHLADVGLSVRWEAAVQQAAELERLRTALAATRSDVDAMQREVHRHVLANVEQQGEVERLRAELAETKGDLAEVRSQRDHALKAHMETIRERDYLSNETNRARVFRAAAEAEQDALEAQVAALQRALADRGDDVLAFQKASETHLPEQARRIRTELNELQTAVENTVAVYQIHQQRHPSPIADCITCRMGVTLLRDRPKTRDNREEIKARLAALDAPEATTERAGLIGAYAIHLRNAGDRADAAEAAIERVRADCEAVETEGFIADDNPSMWVNGAKSYAQRIVAILNAADAESTSNPAVDAFKTWVEGLGYVASLDAPETTEKPTRESRRELLREMTQQAIEAGTYGEPAPEMRPAPETPGDAQ